MAPGSPGYLFAALNRGNVIFSSLSHGVFPNLASRRLLSFDGNARLGFYLVSNSTTDQVLADLAAGGTSANVFFANANANANQFNYSQVLELTDSTLTLAWEDQLGGGDFDFNDLVLRAQVTDTPLPPETALQGVYLYGDFISGGIWGLRPNSAGWENTFLLDSPYGISTFGEDQAGNLYLADYFNGGIYSISV